MKNTDRRGDDATPTTSKLACHECGERNKVGENVEYTDTFHGEQRVRLRWTCSDCLTNGFVHTTIQGKFAELKAEFPAITFGYIGNCGVARWGKFDDRRWYIFLPTNGRVGSPSDRVGGYSTESLGNMLANWDRLVVEVRTKMVGR